MNHNQNNLKHALLMLACCLIPIALILAVSVFGFSLGSLTPLLPFALALMCPLMMIFMMRGMGHEHGADHTHHHSEAPSGKTSQDTVPRVGALKTDSAKQD